MTGTRLLKLEVLALIIIGPKYFPGGGGGAPYIQMIGKIVVYFRGCNRRFGIFGGLFKQNPLKR